MRLRSFVLPFVAAAFIALPAFASEWSIDTGHSEVGFAVRHAMVSTTKGRFKTYSGALNLDDADVAKSKVDVEIDAASIDTGDAKRDEHLRSADFFDAKKYPKLTFKSTKVVKKGPDKLAVTGDLTIKNVTKSVVLDVTFPDTTAKDPWGNVRRGAQASTKISRKEFGLTWNKALETGGILVGDEVNIGLELELIKKG